MINQTLHTPPITLVEVPLLYKVAQLDAARRAPAQQAVLTASVLA